MGRTPTRREHIISQDGVAFATPFSFVEMEGVVGCRASTYTVHNSVKIKLKDGVNEPKSFDDYKVEIDKIDGVNLDETIVID